MTVSYLGKQAKLMKSVGFIKKAVVNILMMSWCNASYGTKQISYSNKDYDTYLSICQAKTIYKCYEERFRDSFYNKPRTIVISSARLGSVIRVLGILEIFPKISLTFLVVRVKDISVVIPICCSEYLMNMD